MSRKTRYSVANVSYQVFKHNWGFAEGAILFVYVGKFLIELKVRFIKGRV